MNAPATIDPQEVKRRSESAVVNAGGRICDWLPYIDFTEARSLAEVVDRALVLNALLQLHFGAPPRIIAKWIEGQSLDSALSAKESALVQKPAEQLSEQERIDLYWYIEALWAFLWATGLIVDMPFDRGVEDFMASMCPNLQANEGAAKFRLGMKLRPYAELYAMRDLCYRFHWWTFDAHLRGEDTGPVRLDIVMERRKALEWILDRQLDWDDVPLDT
jgi:hypothetical protein